MVQRPEGPRTQIIYGSEPGEVNVLRMSVRWDPSVPFNADPLPPPVAFSLAGFDTVSVGSGCQTLRPFSGQIDCPFPDGLLPTDPEVRLGDRDDQAEVRLTRRAVIARGPGDDFIEAGGVSTAVPATTGSALLAGALRASIGGPSNDKLEGSRRRDTFYPGPGVDQIGIEPTTYGL